MIQVNSYGLTLIREFLDAKHINDERFTHDQLLSCASRVEDNYEMGNGAYFEISPFDSMSGRPEICWLPSEAYEELDL